MYDLLFNMKCMLYKEYFFMVNFCKPNIARYHSFHLTLER